MRCAIVGLGRIGAALYRDLEPKLPYLVGVDVDSQRVLSLRAEGYNATEYYSDCQDIGVWIICASSGPYMENIFSIVSRIRPEPGAIISFESTLRVGTMNAISALFARRGYAAGKDVFLIHVPHRVMFGHDQSTLSMPRVIGAVTQKCLEKGLEFYGGFIETLFPVSDVRVAELSKIAENSQRHVDIAFAEALAMYCNETGLDFGTLREAVNTKGNVNLASVDYGIGGECLPKDIVFLNEVTPSPVLEGAIETDFLYRESLLAIAREAGSRVLLRGIGYKRGIKDTYKSRGVDLAMRLAAEGLEVFVEDPLYTADELVAEGLRPVQATNDYDIIIDRGRIISPWR